MRVETSCVEEREADPLIHEIKKFWEVESEGGKFLNETPYCRSVRSRCSFC